MNSRPPADGRPLAARRKYEFAVLVLVVAALALILLRAIDDVQQAIDEARVQSETAALRVELLDVLAQQASHGGALPDSANPLRWVGRQPDAYAGELESPPAANRVWDFDLRRGELVYRFGSGREARLRLVRGSEVAAAPGALSGIGLRRVDGDGGPPAG